jgi:hypothetical protein
VPVFGGVRERPLANAAMSMDADEKLMLLTWLKMIREAVAQLEERIRKS